MNALQKRLFPLESLLYEVTRGIINFKIWKYKHCKIEDTQLLKIGDLYMTFIYDKIWKPRCDEVI